MKKIFVLLALISVILIGLKLTVHFYLSKELSLKEDRIITVNRGDSLTRVAYELGRNNLIDHPRLLAKIGQFYGYGDRIKYGEYLLQPGDDYQSLLDKIVSGDNYKYEITFVEGDHFYKYARLVEEKGLGKAEEFIRLAQDRVFVKELLGEEQKSLEGYLFPETYHFSKVDGVKTIVTTMVRNFLQATQSLDFTKSPLGNRHKTVTLASIVEKETGAAFERPLIASVFLNRMDKKMKLQTDPTIIYGIMDKTGREVNNIRKKDILAPTAYNTYVIAGLPPGPIANPGIEAINAVLNPKRSEYLFFVSQNDGTHIFTKNYQDHLKAVRRYQLDPKMREGKSWRDLKKSKSGGR